MLSRWSAMVLGLGTKLLHGELIGVEVADHWKFVRVRVSKTCDLASRIRLGGVNVI